MAARRTRCHDGAVDDDTRDRPDVPGHRLLHVIGSGGASTVWAGVDAGGQSVAIKVPRGEPDPVSVREAEIERHVLMAVRHEHLVPLRDVVPLEDGRVALVFDLVVGATLKSLVASRGHLRPGEVVTVLSPIAEAVARLHAAGSTHCDISPSNVMLTADGRPLLTDLGAARLAGAGAGAVVGTPGFVAPEVRSGGRPTEASDVFSLGALAWFCLTGNGAPDTFIRLSDDTLVSHLGPELASVVGRFIDPEPERRPASAAVPALVYEAAAAEALEVVVGADEASALTHRLRAEAAAEAPSLGQPAARPWYRLVHVPRPRWPRWAGVVAGLVGVAVLLGWLTHLGMIPGTASSTGEVLSSGPQAVPARANSEPQSRLPGADREPRALLQDLADRRVAALTRRETSSLTAVHRADSPSWQADAAIIGDLTTARQRYSGLRMTVVEADVVSSSASQAVLRARVAVSPYDVVDERGRVVSRPADEGQPLDFHLVHTAAGWRIESISDPRPT